MRTTLKLLFISILFVSISCGSSKSTAEKIDPYAGTWDVLVENTPNGDMKNKLSFVKAEDGTYKGSIISDEGTMDLTDVSIVDSKLTSKFDYQGMEFVLKGAFLDNTFNGAVEGMGYSFTAKGVKVDSSNP